MLVVKSMATPRTMEVSFMLALVAGEEGSVVQGRCAVSPVVDKAFGVCKWLCCGLVSM
jgi:hypothetical protein